MRGITHTTLNTATWLTIITAGQITTGNSLIAPTIIGTTLVIATSRLPDIDHANSGPARRINRLLPGFPTWLEKTFGIRKSPLHWGGTAASAGLLISALLATITPSLWWVGAAIGGSWILHIAGDCLTWKGAPLFAPISFQMVRPRYGRRFQCGGPFERHIVTPIISIWCGIAIAANLYQAFLKTIL